MLNSIPQSIAIMTHVGNIIFFSTHQISMNYFDEAGQTARIVRVIHQ